MKILYLMILGAGLSLPLSGVAGDLAQGKIKAKQTCAVCHGIDGQATVPLAAHISGQQKDYLIIQLRAYRSGKRQHQQMSIIAKPLTNEDIDNLAAWYSNIKVNIVAPEELDTEETPSDSIPEATSSSTAADTEVDKDQYEMNPEIIKSIQDSLQTF